MIRVGKIVAAHGLQGAMVMTHVVGHSKWLNNNDAILLELHKGSFIPFFITQCKAAGPDEYIVNLEDVTSPEAAKKLISKNVYVQEDVVSKHATDSPLLWIGFKVSDKKKGSLGVVDDMMQVGAQWLAKVMINDTEVLLPMVPETIRQINMRTHTIHTDMPDGLLEVYLEP